MILPPKMQAILSLSPIISVRSEDIRSIPTPLSLSDLSFSQMN
jgi:hypothetical protein